MNQSNISTRKVLYRKMNYLRILGSSLGCCMGIGVVGYLSTVTYSALLIPSFGASCVIGMAIPDSAFAQPRNVVGGHFLSGFIGLLCTMSLGTSWWSLAIAVGLAAAIMQLTRTFHPPAASDPILFMAQGSISPYFFLILLSLGSIILIIFFVVYHRLVTKRFYPKYWV